MNKSFRELQMFLRKFNCGVFNESAGLRYVFNWHGKKHHAFREYKYSPILFRYFYKTYKSNEIKFVIIQQVYPDKQMSLVKSVHY